MIRRPPRSTLSSSSAASDVYKRQVSTQSTGLLNTPHMGNCCDDGERKPPELPTSPDQVKPRKCIRPGCGLVFREFFEPNEEDDRWINAGGADKELRERTVADPNDPLQRKHGKYRQQVLVSHDEIYYPPKSGVAKTREVKRWEFLGSKGTSCRYHPQEIKNARTTVGRNMTESYVWKCCRNSNPATPGCCEVSEHQAFQPRHCMAPVVITQLHRPKRKRFKHPPSQAHLVLFVDRKNTALSPLLAGWATNEHFNASFESYGTEVHEGEPLTSTIEKMLHREDQARYKGTGTNPKGARPLQYDRLERATVVCGAHLGGTFVTACRSCAIRSTSGNRWRCCASFQRRGTRSPTAATGMLSISLKPVTKRAATRS
eukprot:TRINITY_DN5898_c0_g1_i6.p1 TRINITY_DN5898_c0_g1~~TRINITY_DN5898_c0_g1_i6.p1  ORF type:complete len:373 (+),score=63.80 TRINITY_DN5898_c0_g1_i6:140-1258(+)